MDGDMGLDIDATKQSPLQEEVDGMRLNLLTLSGALYVALPHYPLGSHFLDVHSA